MQLQRPRDHCLLLFLLSSLAIFAVSSPLSSALCIGVRDDRPHFGYSCTSLSVRLSRAVCMNEWRTTNGSLLCCWRMFAMNQSISPELIASLQIYLQLLHFKTILLFCWIGWHFPIPYNAPLLLRRSWVETEWIAISFLQKIQHALMSWRSLVLYSFLHRPGLSPADLSVNVYSVIIDCWYFEERPSFSGF